MQAPWWTRIQADEVARLRARLLHFVRAKFGPSLAEVEDIVQHAFVMLFRERQKVQAENDGLYRYLHVVARNHGLDRLKSARLRRERLAEAAEHLAHRRPIAPAAGRDDIAAVRAFFCELDELDRLILWSHVVEGRPLSAIATELNLNWHEVAGTVQRVLHRLRQKLDGPPARGVRSAPPYREARHAPGS
ncbi:MAG TPA: sigma-70 family RNA polymerase sigma factor [Phycisphaerae bacterium]|jgi:RNA polymerase sigma factor (sigma-70 family)